MDLDSAVDIHKQPNPEPVVLGKCTVILFFISRPAILSVGMLTQIIICIVLTVVIFWGLINQIMEWTISSTCVHHTFLGWSEKGGLHQCMVEDGNFGVIFWILIGRFVRIMSKHHEISLLFLLYHVCCFLFVRVARSSKWKSSIISKRSSVVRFLVTCSLEESLGCRTALKPARIRLFERKVFCGSSMVCLTSW